MYFFFFLFETLRNSVRYVSFYFFRPRNSSFKLLRNLSKFLSLKLAVSWISNQGLSLWHRLLLLLAGKSFWVNSFICVFISLKIVLKFLLSGGGGALASQSIQTQSSRTLIPVKRQRTEPFQSVSVRAMA